MYAYRSRKPVQYNETQRPAVDALAAVTDKLGQSDAAFASSLIDNFYKWGRLSDKQMPWIDTLTQRATQPKPTAVAYASVDFKPIQDLFDVALRRLKRVKVKTQDATGQAVVFSRAGARSKYAGQVMITDGQPFGSNKFFGRIDTTGEFFATRSATQQICEAVKEFSDDPAGAASRYGRLTGGCSFCNHGLKDSRSIAVGYGPVCARNFGLKWGN